MSSAIANCSAARVTTLFAMRSASPPKGQQYTPQSSEVTVALASTGRTGEISIFVSDCGPGVPADVIGRIFDPLFRVEAARERDSGGVGLCLAIAQEAMRMHGGSAHVEVLPQGGLRATLALRSSTESRFD